MKQWRSAENDFQQLEGVGMSPATTPAMPAAAGDDVGPGLGPDDHRHTGSAVAFAAIPAREILDAAGELLRALAAPVRIAIVLQLQESQRCVHELVDALGAPQPLVSQHLKVLKAAGVVTGERSGREVLYRLADHHLAHIVVDAVAHAGEKPHR
jgi:DNA-binding transcriptional ArsR family regulator